MVREIERKAVNGLVIQLLLLAGYAATVFTLVRGATTDNPVLAVAAVVSFLVLLVLQCGIFSVQPNQARVLTLFGTYVGSVKASGLWWANPFYSKKAISLR